MSKILGSVLDNISENNNEYRKELRSLNSKIDEATSTLVGNIVTISNYVVDFSNTVTVSKEKLVSPISRIIESYVIKDLRNVEQVNEQFVDKINDKIANANIETKADEKEFIGNLNTLLNEKYLQIVNIKRKNFFDENNSNVDVQNAISDFANYISSNYNYSGGKVDELLSNYERELYDLIEVSLKQISKLYLDNFVNGINGSLDTLRNFDNLEETYNEPVKETVNTMETSTYEIPEVPVIPEIPTVPEIPSIPEVPMETSIDFGNVELPSYDSNITFNNEVSNFDIPTIPEVPVQNVGETYETPIDNNELTSNSFEMNVPKEELITPVVEDKKEVKRTYDVEEILKIAKSPILSIPKEEKKESTYVNVEPIKKEEKESFEPEFDEKEIVEELINRLTLRIKNIDERQKNLDEEKARLEEDETFVSDLIVSAENKKVELDNLEEELNNKEEELNKKQMQLEKKINDVMPFANAVLNSEKES